jgi:hypothetical protein
VRRKLTSFGGDDQTLKRPLANALELATNHLSSSSSTGMVRAETNAKMTICKISKGHGHPSNPSHPPLGRGEWGVHHGTSLLITSRMKEGRDAHSWTTRSTWREPTTRNGQVNESRLLIDGNPLNGCGSTR